MSARDVTLPVRHPWMEASEHDRAMFYCDICETHVPVMANDIQAGITVFCPSCHAQMEVVE